MNYGPLQEEDFETLVMIGILAPTTSDELAAALEQRTETIQESVGRLLDAGYVRSDSDRLFVSGIGHKNLSRRHLRKLRDIGRALYIWRGSRG